MPLPQSWVDHLFGRLSIRYGAAFLRQWPDTDPDLVKADWADVLDGFNGGDISYALKYLPGSPPNALQFRDICRRAPREDAPKLEAPHVKPDPERVKELIARIADKAADKTPAEMVAANLRAIQQRGGCLTAAQRSVLEACEKRGEVSGVIGAFAPIDPALLPPGMREGATA